MSSSRESGGSPPTTSRRRFLIGAIGAAALGGAYLIRHKLLNRLSSWTRTEEWTATPPLRPHDAERDRATLYVAQGGTPPANVDEILKKLGGIETIVGKDDVVIIKVSAQWWNQGMTNVAAVKRTIERILEVPDFSGEVIVFENVHFRLADGSGLSRAWTHPSERNVDVEGWTTLGDLVTHFGAADAPVSFVGLVDAGATRDAVTWRDPGGKHGVYGGDERGPIGPDEDRDGYHWDFDAAFRHRRSRVDHAQTPLTWPRFTSPKTGLVVDLRDGVFQRAGGKLEPVKRKLTWINMTTANEHFDTGLTAACKSTMGVVDMSAGSPGIDPRTTSYMSCHDFGYPGAQWRMAGPLADFAKKVRAPDLYLTVAEWVGATPATGWSDETSDVRIGEAAAVHTKTVVAGTDPVAIDAWCARHLLMPIAGARKEMVDLDDESSKIVKFLRYYRWVAGSGTLDPKLVTIV